MLDTQLKRSRVMGEGVNTLIDPGSREINILRLASNVADAQTITIGNDVYEFDRAANGVTAGRIAITGHADDTPANASTKIVSTINAQGTEPVTAVKIGDSEILIYSDSPRAYGLACAETLAGSNNVWSNATMYGGRSHRGKPRRVAIRAQVPTATEVALGHMYFVFAFVPVVLSVDVYVTLTPGVAKAWNGAVAITGTRVAIDNGGDTDWAETDTVVVVVADS